MADLHVGRMWPNQGGSRECGVCKGSSGDIPSSGSGRQGSESRGWRARGSGRLMAVLGFRFHPESEEASLWEDEEHICDSEAENACRLWPSSQGEMMGLDRVSGSGDKRGNQGICRRRHQQDPVHGGKARADSADSWASGLDHGLMEMPEPEMGAPGIKVG